MRYDLERQLARFAGALDREAPAISFDDVVGRRVVAVDVDLPEHSSSGRASRVDGVSWIDTTPSQYGIGEPDLVIALAPVVAARRPARRRVGWVALGVAAVAVVVLAVAITAVAPERRVEMEGGSEFASAIEASGVLTSPSADEVRQAMDADLYRPGTGPTQISANGSYVSLRTCRWLAHSPDDGPSPACPNGFPASWAYETGTADGTEVHHGILGAANHLEVFVLDDRFFVVLSAADTQAPQVAWLIDAATGEAGPLSWRDTPATLRSRGQALLVCDKPAPRCSLPTIVDGRDGTIQPLSVPEDAAPGVPVAQHGTDRIWVGTASEAGPLGLAYSDDGGRTWTHAALPEGLTASRAALLTAACCDKLLEIAADGDRVAVTYSWGWGDRRTTRDALYLSDDAGRSWTPAPPSEPGGNGAHLYVLIDGRLVLTWSIDTSPQEVFASSGTQWADLQHIGGPQVAWTEGDFDYWSFAVNRAGVAVITSSTNILHPDTRASDSYEDSNLAALDAARGIAVRFSTDLANWTTIEGLCQLPSGTRCDQG